MNHQRGRGLAGCSGPLVDHHDVLLLDLDGVVYVGSEPVVRAATALAQARSLGARFAFVTNNASRSPEAVSEHLNQLGVRAEPSEVVTSGQAAARVLAELLPAGAAVLVVGTDVLRAQVRARGLRVVSGAVHRPAAVLQGYAADTCWQDLAEAAAALHAGAQWVVTNLDATLPSTRGPMPGNGALVNAVRMATGGTPVVCGKPQPALYQESVDRTGARRPLVVGDRLDTDIAGAARIGYPSMVVLTGATSAADLLCAAPAHRPNYLAADLGGLLVAHRRPARDADGSWRCAGWRVERSGAELVLGGDGVDIDALRALCSAAWTARDITASAASRAPGVGDGTDASAPSGEFAASRAGRGSGAESPGDSAGHGLSPPTLRPAGSPARAVLEWLSRRDR